MVIAIESVWFDRLRTTTIYRYRLPEATFEALDDAWMFVSRQTVVPLAVEALDDLPKQLLDAGVELRICRSLVPLGRAIIQTTMHYSLIRMRNAQRWAGTRAG